jgi:hypothetical protein
MLKNHADEAVESLDHPQQGRSQLDQGAPEIVRKMLNDDETIKDSEPPDRRELIPDVNMGDLPPVNPEDFVDFLPSVIKIDPKERLPTMDISHQPWIRGRR